MHFALLGDHPDGLDMARALAETGRHEIAYYCGPATGAELLARWALTPRREGDMESVLSDPAITAVIVAGKPASRAAQLRRALQAERHVLCVHPADASPDAAYEAAMIQADARQLLFPILPESLHPAFRRFSELTTKPQADSIHSIRLFEMERWLSDDVFDESENLDVDTNLSGWDVLRMLGGDIGEVSALAPGATIEPDQPVVVSGQFLRGGMFQASFLPRQAEPRWRITAVTETGYIHLLFRDGWPGPATLTWTDDYGQEQSESWEAWNPWPSMVEAFEAAFSDHLGKRRSASDFSTSENHSEHIQKLDGITNRHVAAATTGATITYPVWNDETRLLELDDAVRRSVERRRTSILEFQEVTEEATVKGTMTLIGCSIIWISLMLLILSTWLPWLAWFIVPVFVLFLIVQVVLRWVVRPTEKNIDDSAREMHANSS